MQQLLKFIFIAFVGMPLSNVAQQITISGRVIEQNSKEPLIAANVYLTDLSTSTYTDNSGFYTLSVLNKQPIKLVFSYIGYETDTITFTTLNDTTINYIMKKGSTLQTVEITDAYEQRKQNANRIKLNQASLKKKAFHFGETDVLKFFQFMPGVTGGNEGTSNLFVRGGSPDQNLVLLDDIPLYNPTHLGGFLSVFDVNVIKEINLHKGSFPAEYSGRLSSIIDARLKDGHANKWKKEYSIGLLSSKIFFEGPLKKDKTTMLLSARRSLIDLFIKGSALVLNLDEVVGFAINDVNFKLQHQLANNKSLSFHFYRGRDRFRYAFNTENEVFDEDYSNNISWGNTIAGLTRNQFGKKYTLKNIVSFTNYKYKVNLLEKITDKTTNEKRNLSFTFSSGITDLISKNFVTYHFNTKLKVKNGIDFSLHRFAPQLKSSEQDIPEELNVPAVYSTEVGAYSQWSYELNNYINLQGGFHFTYFSFLSENYHSFHPQPRLKLNLTPNKDLLFFASYSKMNQFLHLLSNSGAGFPTNLWVPATNIAKPSSSNQFSVGVNYFWNKNFEVSVEYYNKKFNRLIEYQEGISLFKGSNKWQDKVALNGVGKAQGLELLLKYKVNKLDAQIAYTLAKNDRQFNSINNNEPYPFKYDRRHDFSIFLNYKAKPGVTLNLSWVYNTGTALTLPTVVYNLHILEESNSNDNYFIAELYNNRNSYRTPAYHRLDFNCAFTKPIKKGERTWALGIYNVYNRLNPYYIYFDRNDVGEIKLNSITLFPILPSISYTRVFD